MLIRYKHIGQPSTFIKPNERRHTEGIRLRAAVQLNHMPPKAGTLPLQRTAESRETGNTVNEYQLVPAV